MMTTESNKTRFFLFALAAALVLTFGSDASAEEPRSFTAGGAGSTGTLPASSGTGTGGIPLRPFFAPYAAMLRKASKPAASLNGLVSELDQVIAQAFSPDGSGWFSLSPVAPNGTVTITYYGNVTLELDRHAFLASQVSANLSVAPNFNGGVLSLKVAGRRRTSQVLHTGSHSLQLQRLIRTGLVDEGLAVKSFSKGRSRVAGLEILGLGERIRIEQSH
jgi:hypothetical protein